MPETVKKTLMTILKIILVVLAVFLFTKIVRYILPFILAYVFASLIEPIVKFLERKIHIKRRIGTVISIIVSLGAIISILTLLILRLVREIKNVYGSLDINVNGITSFFNNIIDEFNMFYIQLPTEITDFLENIGQSITSDFQSTLKKITDFASYTIQFAMDIPGVFLFILVTIIATYFISSDKDKLLNFLARLMPTSRFEKYRSITNDIFSGIFGWLRAQLIIMTITFTELLIGLSIIGVENSLLLSITIAIVDIFPILGTGTILIPWAIIQLIIGKTKRGLSLFLLYVIITLVRQLIEPKIVGQQIGVHPLLTLAGMYIGLKIFGVGGMIFGPLTVVVIKYLIGGITSDESFQEWFKNNVKHEKRDQTIDLIRKKSDNNANKV